MNHAALAKLQQRHDELIVVLRDKLAKHSDGELLEIIDAHLEIPELVLLAALRQKGYENLLAMAVVPIYQELLRRKELQLMEAVDA